VTGKGKGNAYKAINVKLKKTLARTTIHLLLKLSMLYMYLERGEEKE